VSPTVAPNLFYIINIMLLCYTFFNNLKVIGLYPVSGTVVTFFSIFIFIQQHVEIFFKYIFKDNNLLY